MKKNKTDISSWLMASLAVIFLASFSQAVWAGEKSGKKEAAIQQEKMVYVCPMHSDVRSDKPGRCPKCGMYLEKPEPAPKTK